MAIMTTAKDPSETKFDNELLKSEIYMLKLEKIEVRNYTSKKDGEAYQKLLWMFDTVEEKKGNGYPYRMFRRTGLVFGADNADLTKLITEIYGRRLTTEEYGSFDVQRLEGQVFRCMVGKEIWADGTEHNIILSIEATDPAGLPWPAGVTVASTGHRADSEDEEPPLTEKQKATLIKRLKLSDEEAAKMDAWGRLPDDEDYSPDFGDPFAEDN